MPNTVFMVSVEKINYLEIWIEAIIYFDQLPTDPVMRICIRKNLPKSKYENIEISQNI